jgi:hypothetical protein
LIQNFCQFTKIYDSFIEYLYIYIYIHIYSLYKNYLNGSLQIILTNCEIFKEFRLYSIYNTVMKFKMFISYNLKYTVMTERLKETQQRR